MISRAERERTSRQSSILGNLPRSPSLQLFEIFIEEDFCKKKCLKQESEVSNGKETNLGKTVNLSS